MSLVRFESDDHHSQIVLGTHDIDELTPRLGDDTHVDIRLKNGRVFTVRETANQVDAKLAAHGAHHLRVKRRVFVNAPVVVETKPQETLPSEPATTPEITQDAAPPVIEQVTETPVETPVETLTAEQPAIEQVTETPEAQPAAESVVSQTDKAGTEN